MNEHPVFDRRKQRHQFDKYAFIRKLHLNSLALYPVVPMARSASCLTTRAAHEDLPCLSGTWPGKAELYIRCPGRNRYIPRNREFFMLKFLASTAGIIFLVGLVVIIGLLMLIF
ncbi:hypothetical protein [Pseudomonas sp. FME51]|uniref:hypothetical protein n=1 Tax=Pseudomonas sp. FME51 TaxID=2742609 RepID=UPI00186921E5|nr:hypothetical protein [Pseudomonas sp. FME51]